MDSPGTRVDHAAAPQGKNQAAGGDKISIEALEERRHIRIRHARFDAALAASAIYNVNRSRDTKPLSPFDFIGMEEKPDPEQEKRDAALRGVLLALSRVPDSITPEAFDTLKQNMIDRLTKQGLDGEGILKEALHE